MLIGRIDGQERADSGVCNSLHRFHRFFNRHIGRFDYRCNASRLCDGIAKMLWNENEIASVLDCIASDMQSYVSVFHRQPITREIFVRWIA